MHILLCQPGQAKFQMGECVWVVQITSARQLSKRSKGEATVSLGPQQSTGVAVSVRTKFKHCQTVASLEVHNLI